MSFRLFLILGCLTFSYSYIICSISSSFKFLPFYIIWISYRESFKVCSFGPQEQHRFLFVCFCDFMLFSVSSWMVLYILLSSIQIIASFICHEALSFVYLFYHPFYYYSCNIFIYSLLIFSSFCTFYILIFFKFFSYVLVWLVCHALFCLWY